jgi:hypothetical protein
MNSKNSNRKIKYAKLRQAGYSAGFCTKYKDRKMDLIDALVKLASDMSTQVNELINHSRRSVK